MKKLSTAILAEIVETKRKAAKMTQAQLAEKTGINRAQLSRLEQEDYYPSMLSISTFSGMTSTAVT